MADSSNRTPAECVAIVRRLVFEVQEQNNTALIDELFRPDFFDHSAPPGMSPHLDGVRGALGYLHSNIKDIKMEIVHSIGDGKMVCTMKFLRGTQTGELMGKPATNGPIELQIMDFVTIVDGKVKDHWATVGQIKDL